MGPSPPRATYRLQLRRGFGLPEVRSLLPYLDRLGIDTVYLSPLFAAVPGSDHGYDVIDPTRIDPDRGRPSDLVALARAAHARRMRILLDIVPNHLSTSPLNPWWKDVLEHGRSSRFAPVFDIEWTGPDGRPIPISLLVLSAPIREILQRGELRLEWDRHGPALAHGGLRYPLSPRSLETVRVALGGQPNRTRSGPTPGNPPGSFAAKYPTDSKRIARLRGELGRAATRAATRAAVEQLIDEFPKLAAGSSHRGSWAMRVLGEQEYRFYPYWEVERINYRRFFDIAGLVGVRVEDPRVFELTHARLLDWASRGLIDGIRVDHIDGLADPRGYLRRLRQRLESVRPDGAPEIPVWVEKILAPRERLPDDWPVHGTTGYEAMALLTGLFVDPSGRKVLERLYRKWTGEGRSFEEVAFQAKEEVTASLFPRERSTLSSILARGGTAPIGESAISARAVAAFTAALPVYRTYARRTMERPEDRAALRSASVRAVRFRPELRGAIRKFSATIRDGASRAPVMHSDHAGRLRWQQWTGAVAAKGIEDTALYRWVPVAALNEVGASPDGPDLSAARFHRLLAERAERRPDGLSASSTHDSKWGEEARSRLAALSELPEVWSRMVARWERPGAPSEGGTERAPRLRALDRYRMLEACIATFPIDPLERPSFPDRFARYTRKALREARDSTTWAHPSVPYEDAAVSLARRIADPAQGFATRPDLREDALRFACIGHWNALSALLLKMTMPGIPDFYQGSERASLHLIDPDNRRPVDFRRLERLERALGPAARPVEARILRAWSRRWWDGRLRLYVIRRALALRRSEAELFARGDYLPLTVRRGGPEGTIAFARVLGDRWAIVIAGRNLGRRGVDSEHPPIGPMFEPARLELTRGAPHHWRDVLVAKRPIDASTPRRGSLKIAEVLAHLPCALLVGADSR